MYHRASETPSKGRYNHGLPDRSNKEEDGFDLPEYEPYGEDNFEEPEATPRAPASEPLNVEVIDMCQSVNKPLHHTEEFDNTKLIVRRGQEFYLRVLFTRPLEEHDDYQLEFLIGSNPTASQGSLIQVVFGPRAAHSVWPGRVVQMEGPRQALLGITPSATAIVGKFRLYIAIARQRGMQRTRRDPSNDVYLLFNAWCPEDPVYMDDEAQRQEYVLEDTGTIYQGDPQAVSERSWMYGQFELGVLDACIYILDASQMLIVNRADPVKLVRKGSAMLNSQDDNGVLVGNWSDDYSMGTAPTLWTGSVKILLQYAHTGVPVCFAQCWVFAGVFNTFLRCLGIPARALTNFSSAHDNTGNLKTDLIFSTDGSPDKENTRDSIWNYHCWNEAWMTRPDLPEGLGGWQAVDSTPQETSDGHFRCGPASVKAIKDGLMSHPYDAAFVFAEVNSDLIFRKRDKYGILQTFRVDKTHVGHVILTKAVGVDMPHDLTHDYKYHEGCEEDIVTMKRAEDYGMKREIPEFLAAVSNVQVTIDVQQVNMGEGFTLAIDLTNEGDHEAATQFTLIGSVVFYTGVATNQFKDHRDTFTVAAHQTHRALVHIEPRDYMHALGSQNSMQFILTGQAGSQSLSAIRVVTLKAPPLSLAMSGESQAGYEMMVTLTFSNPMNNPLSNVYVAMEGPRLMPYRTKYYRDLAPNATIKWTETFVPKVPGLRRMMAALVCDNFNQVWGSTHIEIKH